MNIRVDIKTFGTLILLSLWGCQEPVTFDRENTVDYGGDNFIPFAPTELDVKLYSYSEDPFYVNDIIEVTWQDNSDHETGYKVERRYKQSDYQTVALLPPNSTQYFDTLQVPGVYVYRVSTISDSGNDHYIKKEKHLSQFGPGPKMSHSKHADSRAVVLDNDHVAIYTIHTNSYQSEILNLTTLEWQPADVRPEHPGFLFNLEQGRILNFSDDISIYDQASNSWSLVNSINYYQLENAVMISNDEILFSGKKNLGKFYSRTYEIYSISENSFRSVPEPEIVRHSAGAILLKNGKILFPSFTSSGNDEYRNRPLIYSPSNEKWSVTGILKTEKVSSFLLDDGSVIVHENLYDPETQSWTRFGDHLQKSYDKFFQLRNGDVIKKSSHFVYVFDEVKKVWSEPTIEPYHLIPHSQFLRFIALPNNTALVYWPENRYEIFRDDIKLNTAIYRKPGID